MLNKVNLIGNVGSIETISNEGVKLSVATSEYWTDKNTNEKQSKTEWHQVVIWGNLANIAQNLFQKGSKVFIEGQLQTKSWKTETGETKYTTQVVVSGMNGKILALDKKPQNETVQETKVESTAIPFEQPAF